MFTCSSLILNVWHKWYNYPVILSFAEKPVSIWEIPFPSVTICPQTKSRQEVLNYTDKLWQIYNYGSDSLTEKENFYMEALTQLCLDDLLNMMEYGKLFANGSDLVNAIEELSVIFHEALICKWSIMEGNCAKYFHKILTDEGLCYSFNALDPRDIYRDEALVNDTVFREYHGTKAEWSLEKGYGKNAGPDTYPFRLLSPGVKSGLFLTVQSLRDRNDRGCQENAPGFKLLLLTPGEIPRVSQQFYRIPLDQEVLISIKPKIITTSDGLLHYDPTRRQCYFEQERYLRYFKMYTQSNCELECLSNFTMAMCGCVTFSMPRVADIPVCGAGQVKCYVKAKERLHLHQFNQGYMSPAESIDDPAKCNCLPACTSITYEADISQGGFDVDPRILTMKTRRPRASFLRIFFEESQFLASKRSEMYGTTDFIANCGGLLGLFMGVSSISFVELVYFCTARLLTNLKMRRRSRMHQERMQMANGENMDSQKT